MTKILLPLFTLFSIFSLNAQSNFEYLRTWGTYFGPVGAKSWLEYSVNPIYFDSQNNIYTNGQVLGYNTYQSSYYDQFTMGGGQSFYQTSNNSASNSSSNITNAKFTSSGVLQKFEYYSNFFAPQGYRKALRYIDNNDNKYYEYGNIIPISATAGTWYTSAPVNYAVLLVKESPAGTVLWATYLPSKNPDITGDDNGNIYIGGNTIVKQGLTTPNSFQENYLTALNSSNMEIENSFIAKLNSSGQRVWATYFPGSFNKVRYFNNHLYVLGYTTIQNIPTNIATSNAFQTAQANHFLQKFDTNTGSQVWGTYYGKPGDNYNTRMYNIAVNENGLFVVGDANGGNGSTIQNYFATTGAHQTSIAGEWDLFLSKFDLNGNRSWSTYFGSSKTDLMQGCTQPLDISGEDIYFTGYTWGATNNLATAGAFQSSPQFNATNSTNQFFVKFKSDGTLQWCSYYGGTNNAYNTPLNIAINNSSLYLYGETTATNGFTTPGCWQPQIIDPTPTLTSHEKNVNFLAKFDIKSLSTQETSLAQKIILFDNPNNGKFGLKGDILEKENCNLDIYDLAGRLMYSQNLSKMKNQEFNLQNLLSNGNYILHIKNNKKESIATFKMTVKK